MVGCFESYSKDDRYISIEIKKLFHEYSSAAIICEQPIQLALKAAQGLKPGDEVVVEVTVAVEGYKRLFHLKSLARFDEPDTILLGVRRENATKNR